MNHLRILVNYRFRGSRGRGGYRVEGGEGKFCLLTKSQVRLTLPAMDHTRSSKALGPGWRRQRHPLQCSCLEIPGAGEPGGLQSMGSLRVGHDSATSLSLFTFMHWRRKWPPTRVFLPGESQGRRSLVGCRLWGRTESDTTEAT